MNFAGLKCSNHVIYTWLKVKDWLNFQLPKSSEMSTVNLVRVWISRPRRQKREAAGSWRYRQRSRAYNKHLWLSLRMEASRERFFSNLLCTTEVSFLLLILMLASCTKSCIQCSTNKANNISERRLTYHRWYCDSPCKALEHLLGFFVATRGLQMLHHKTTRLQNWKNPPNCWSYWHPESTWAQRSKSAGKKKEKEHFTVQVRMQSNATLQKRSFGVGT